MGSTLRAQSTIFGSPVVAIILSLVFVNVVHQSQNFSILGFQMTKYAITINAKQRAEFSSFMIVVNNCTTPFYTLNL